jgi:hypothetical protein
MGVNYIMTAEVVIQLPGSYLYILSYDCRSRNPATRIMGVKYNIMTAEVVIQLPGSYLYTVTTAEVVIHYNFCRHNILYTHYPGSWITTSAVMTV